MGVIFHIGKMYCLGMVPLIFIGVILLQDYVLIPANTIVSWYSIRDLVVSYLIALDKCPGVMLIEIGEIPHRIIGKAVCLATHLNVALVVAQNNCV